MINISIKSSHNTASGFLSIGFRMVSKMRKRATFALFWGSPQSPYFKKKTVKG